MSTSPLIPTVNLANGVEIPQLGFGTYKVVSGVYDTIRHALDAGYRHIDTAQMYGNEEDIGRALTDSGIDRSELFITSKLRNDAHEPRDTQAAFEQSLRDLRTDYLDLFLVHWPLPMHYDGDIARPWSYFEEAYGAEKTRAIGVSNFQISHLKTLMAHVDICPHVNQIEVHPYLHNNEVRLFHADNAIVTEAWSPLARGRIFPDPVLQGIAADHEVSVAQIAIRWALQRGDVLFPKASTPHRQAQNLDVFGFTLSDSEMERISDLDRGEEGRTGSHPDTMDRLHL